MGRKKWLIIATLILMFIPLVSASDFCEDYMDGERTCQMVTPMLSCGNYTYDILVSNGTIIEEGNLTLLNQSNYYFNFSQPLGDYLVRVCNGWTREIFIGGKDKMILAIITLIPLIFGFFMLIGAVSLGKDHHVLKIFLFLLSPITVWVSFHFGMISLVYTHGLPELQEAIGDTTYWMAWLFFFFISYFLIYTIWKWAGTIAQKKKERIEY